MIDILLIEVNLAHMHTKTMNVAVSLCVYRGDFYELFTLILCGFIFCPAMRYWLPTSLCVTNDLA